MDTKDLEKKLNRNKIENKDKVGLLIDLSKQYLYKENAKSYIFGKQAESMIDSIDISNDIKTELSTIMDSVQEEITAIELPGIYLEAGTEYLRTVPETAFFCFSKGLEISKLENNPKHKADLLNNIGLYYNNRSDFEMAFHYFEEGLSAYELQEDKTGMSKSHNNLGTISCRLGDYNRGLKHFTKAKILFHEIGNNSGKAFCSNNIGSIYYEQKNYYKALEYYRKSYEIFKGLDNKRGIAMTLNNLGSISTEKGDITGAMEYFQKSLKVKEDMDDPLGISNSYVNIGDAHRILGNYEEAREYFRKALKLKTKLDDKSGLAITYNNISELESILENYAEAEKNAHQCLKLSLEIGTLIHQRFAYEQLYKIKEVQEDFREALKWHKLYKKVNDKICNEENSNQLNEIQTKYNSVKREKEAEIYRLKNTELAQVNDEVKLKNEELQSNKEHLELINKILRHDLTNNLSVLRSSYRIFERTKNENVLAEGATYVEKSFKLINKMRNHERLCGSGKMRLINLHAFMEQYIKNYPSLEFEIEEASKFYANDALNSVVDNLISNAKEHGKASKIFVQFLGVEPNCKLLIADNGIGIPDEVKARIFEEGFKHGDSGKNGIGLYIVKKSMEEIGGDVIVRDHEPQGTEFILSF